MTENSISIFAGSESDFKNVAVAIKLTDSVRQQRHLGLFLKPEQEPIKLLHLAWHNDFRLDSYITEGYFYVPTFNGGEETLGEIFVDWLLTVWEENRGGLPYSILYNELDFAFDESGRCRELSNGEGFTCSTFILECFKSHGYDLIKYDTWPIRSDDGEWAGSIFSLLEKTHGDSSEHIQAQRSHGMVTRYRPEEVAAAANLSKFDGNKLCFHEIHPFSVSIAEKVS